MEVRGGVYSERAMIGRGKKWREKAAMVRENLSNICTSSHVKNTLRYITNTYD